MNETETSLALTATESLMQAAIEKGQDLRDIVELLREEREAEARLNGIRALSAAKAEIPPIKKTRPGQHVTKKGTLTLGNFAPLEDIQEIVDPILPKHGLTYDWDREIHNDKEYIVCIITHEQGYEKRSKFPAIKDSPAGKNDIQAVASGDSYGKRYSLMGALALRACDPDDDAEATLRESNEPVQRITDEQALSLEARLADLDGDYNRFCGFLRVERLSELPAARYGEAVQALEAKAAKKAREQA